VSSPAAASPDLTARDFLDADWTVHALRPGERELSQLAACGRWLTWRIAGGSYVRTRCGLGQAALRPKRRIKRYTGNCGLSNGNEGAFMPALFR
jgi:hypothetical protein